MNLTADAQAILLLCSHLGMGTPPSPAPLTLKDWNPLERRLQSAALSPGWLLGKNAADLQTALDLSETEAERLEGLLRRTGAVTLALERLAALGIQPLTRLDETYPQQYRQRLKESAPVLLFTAGERSLLGQAGIAVVGSRRLDETGQNCARFVGRACAEAGWVLYSGGAKGTDTLSMRAALAAGGKAVGILADSLEKAVRTAENHAALQRGNLCLVTPYSPNAPFSVGTAMSRNRFIYAIADYAVVVASDAEKGGTWAGATDALKAKYVPVFAREGPEMPEGNKLLLQKGAVGLPYPFPEGAAKLIAWLQAHAAGIERQPEPHQPGLF